MAQQSHFYPCDETKDTLCTTCNAGLTSEQGPNGTNGTNGGKYTSPSSGESPTGQIPPLVCSDWCDAECNNECEENQAYCYVEHQSIKDHGDVGAYNGSTILAGDFIHEKWSATYWNTLIDKINMAETVGKLGQHGSAGTVTAPIGNDSFYTASLYNQVNTKLCNFNVSYNKVNAEDLITATIANAIGTAYNDATFSYSACDVCNATGSQSLQECSCNCPTCSSCPTCPTCPTCSTCPSCSCNCSCSSCSCNCSSCSCPSCSTPATTPSLKA